MLRRLAPWLLLLPSLPLLAAEPAGPRTVVIRAARMLDVRAGKMVSPAVVVVVGDHIHALRLPGNPAGVTTIDLGDRTLLPGLIDAHVHLFLHPGDEDLQTVR